MCICRYFRKIFFSIICLIEICYIIKWISENSLLSLSINIIRVLSIWFIYIIIMSNCIILFGIDFFIWYIRISCNNSYIVRFFWLIVKFCKFSICKIGVMKIFYKKDICIVIINSSFSNWVCSSKVMIYWNCFINNIIFIKVCWIS